MKHRKKTNFVLGVNVAQQLIEAVLLVELEDHVHVQRRIIRTRGRSEEFTTPKSLTKALPGLVGGGTDADYSIDVGGGNGHEAGGADVTFLASEFGQSAKKKDAVTAQTTVFASQLAEILDECRLGGYEVSRIAFCVAPPDVSYVNMDVAAGGEGKKKTKSPADGPSRRVLIERLREQHQEPIAEQRVAFVPMTSLAGVRRFVALVPAPAGSVAGTLEALLAQKRAIPAVRTEDAELAAYARFARRVIPEERAEQRTALVRVGPEDTLILFFAGAELRHYERLRSLTTYDAPDTICSRVLLQQDEQKIGELQHLLVMTEGRTDQLLSAFRRTFSDAAVETVQDALATLGVQPPRDADGFPSSSMPAVLAGLRMLQDWDQDDPDFAVHLLPKTMRRDRKKLPVAWHTVLMLVILAVVSFGFSWRYMEQQAEIDRQREEMRLNPVEIAVENPALLKARVDSLQTAYLAYTHALRVIDSLLVGSDRWTRLHERITRSTSDIGGIWLTAVVPVGSGSVRISGTATTRTRVAQFARRHGGSIAQVSSHEIKHASRDVRVYDFAIVAPVPTETPRVALYLQDVADGHVRDTRVDSVLAAHEAATLYAPGTAPQDGGGNR